MLATTGEETQMGRGKKAKHDKIPANFRLPVGLVEELDAIAKREGRTRTAIAEEALKIFLAIWEGGGPLDWPYREAFLFRYGMETNYIRTINQAIRQGQAQIRARIQEKQEKQGGNESVEMDEVELSLLGLVQLWEMTSTVQGMYRDNPALILDAIKEKGGVTINTELGPEGLKVNIKEGPPRQDEGLEQQENPDGQP